MGHLSFIGDDKLREHIRRVVKVGQMALHTSEKKFHTNVIDPFSPIFEMGVNRLSAEEWADSEKRRQSQKTLQNAIGEFHERILGSVVGWRRFEKGNEIDLANSDGTIIAEIKNKYNTVSGGKLVDHYVEFDNLVNNKASKYSGSTAYLVQIIPKKPERYDLCFTPADKAKGNRKPTDERIRIIDGASFYEIVTGDPNALANLHQLLPRIIAEECDLTNGFDRSDLAVFEDYFTRAYSQLR